MRGIVVAGGGKIGGVIAEMLSETGDYAVTVIDRSAQALEACAGLRGVTTRVADMTDPAALASSLGYTIWSLCAISSKNCTRFTR